MRVTEQFGTLACAVDFASADPSQINPRDWYNIRKDKTCRDGMWAYVRDQVDRTKATIGRYLSEGKEWEAFYTEFQTLRGLFEWVKLDSASKAYMYAGAQRDEMLKTPVSYPSAGPMSRFSTKLGVIGGSVIADKKVTPQDAWIAAGRKQKVEPIWKKIPWPEIVDKRWIERCAMGKIPLAGGFAFGDYRFWTDAYNGAFWKKAHHWDAIEWDKHIADVMSSKTEAILSCAQHKMIKNIEGKQRTSMWMSTMAPATMFVMPAGIMSMFADAIVSKGQASITQDIAIRTASISQLPSFLQPLFKHWMKAYAAWGEKHGLMTSPEESEAAAAQVGPRAITVAPGETASSKLPIMALVAAGVLGLGVVLYFMKK